MKRDIEASLEVQAQNSVEIGSSVQMTNLLLNKLPIALAVLTSHC